MCELEEDENNGNLRMQNAMKPSLQLCTEKNQTNCNPQVHIVNNPMPISSNLSEPLRDDPNVVYPLGKIPPNFNASVDGNASSTSCTFSNNQFYWKCSQYFK